MSKKKKNLDLVENQVIEDAKEQPQETLIPSEEMIEDFSEVIEETFEESPIPPSEPITEEPLQVEETVNKNEPSVLTEERIDKVENPKKKKPYKMWFILSVCLFFILLLFLLFSTIFALIYGSKSTIIQGVFIKDIDVSSLTREQALEKVSTIFKEKLEQPITFVHNEYETTVFPEQFDVSFALEEAVDMAYAKGRSREYFPE